MWRKSPRYARTQQIDPNTINRSVLKLTATFPKRLTSLLMNLRSRRIQLSRHLHRIGKSITPNCPHCPQEEGTAHHFLFNCPRVRHERHTLTTALPVGRKASSLPFLLTNADAIHHLVLIQYCRPRFLRSRPLGSR
ncbi:hypothetical protein M405DRAFT_822535 [Rhizopogon salebrosus TDB-379]|nr:hypothetical protein M405DRAFT_822535 [Rhizopogon salebrosus TDB-379]